MISGGRVRRRRRNVVRLGAVAAATVLVGSTAYGVLQVDLTAPGTDQGPASTPSPVVEEPPGLEPGRPYRMVVGSLRSGPLIEAEVTVDSDRWVDGDFARLGNSTGTTWVGFGVYEPVRLAAGTGCVDDRRMVMSEDTPDAVARQLAGLPRSEVLQAPARTEAFGRSAVHLRMRIDAECLNWYRVAETERGARGITYTAPGVAALNVIIDFWVMGVDGTPVIVDQWRNADAPAEIVYEATRARESVTIFVD
ncbi:hypothetical protein ASG94_14645 [Nocardioides sp. Soil805]|nr:hypothetical protein ASG94_14645 [Nocardioides sp. Soil805]